MPKRRMFSLDIVDSDIFLEMPISTQALYFHIGMRADDDGICANAKRITRDCGASPDDLKILLAKRFILIDEAENVIIIKHWKMNNYIQKDRYIESTYKETLKKLYLDDKNAYTFEPTELPCIQNVSKMYTQDSIDKDSIDKDSIKIKLDKTAYSTHAIEITNLLIECKYIQLDPDDYVAFIEETLKDKDFIDVKVKVKYFIEQTCSLEEVCKDKENKPVFKWVFNNDAIVDRFNYFKTSIEQSFLKDEMPF